MSFVRELERCPFYQGQIVYTQTLPARPARRVPLPPLPNRLREALHRLGISSLYGHQAATVAQAHDGKSVVLVSGVGSGKSLAYLIPVLEASLAGETSLLLFPTKALAHDQLRVLNELNVGTVVGAYDGDTPQDERQRLRKEATVLLTNPDMLHQGILPHHNRWGRFLRRLRYVVVDEVHIYRGVFGSNVANVFRRLQRVAAHHGARPQFLATSGTIANPLEHAERLTGMPMGLVADDSSPRGKKDVHLWNPALVDRSGSTRRSALMEARNILVELVLRNTQTIAFTQSRHSAELLSRLVRDALGSKAGLVAGYRAGYLPEERRAIERALNEKRLLAVVSTNALELGIDIGSLDAAILVGYPGSIASFWQQVGRAGRTRKDSMAFFIATQDAIDQYLIAHPSYLFGRAPEHAVIDPGNPDIVMAHLRCACAEVPVPKRDLAFFGKYAPDIAKILAEARELAAQPQGYCYIGSRYPAADIDLRAAGAPFVIKDLTGRTIGTLDSAAAPSHLHPEAIYLHMGQSYIVRGLDLEGRVATVERTDADYYTRAQTVSDISILSDELTKRWRKASLHYGEVKVITRYPMFKKARLSNNENIGYSELSLPDQELETMAMWLVPPDLGRIPLVEALAGVANLITQVAPLFIMCDTCDIGVSVQTGSTERPSLFIYDLHRGGIGLARSALDLIEDMARAALEVVKSCRCPGGCPSCVGVGEPIYFSGELNQVIPHKRGAAYMLCVLLGVEPPDPTEEERGATTPGEQQPVPPSATPPTPLPEKDRERLKKHIRKLKSED